MKITEHKNKGLAHSFNITVSNKALTQEAAKRLQNLTAQAKLPGFRPGKVPLSVVEQKYGQAVRGEVAEFFIQQGLQKALADNKLRSANKPKVDVTSFKNGQDLEFTIDIEVLPQIPPVDFSKIKIEKLEADVTDKEIDDALNRLTKNRQESEVLDEKRKTKKGDIIVIDFVGSIDGKEFKGGNGKDYFLELGSNTFIPGFEDQLTGINVPGESIVEVTFPEHYHASEMAGKKATFNVTLKELRKAKRPEINDDFAKTFGQENLDSLKKLITTELTKEYNNVSKAHLKRDLLDALAKLTNFDAPEGMLDMEFDAIWKQFETARTKGDIDKSEKDKSDTVLKKEYKAIAERRVKLGLMLAEVSNLNKIVLSQEDISGAIEAEARRFPGQEKRVFDFYAKNHQALEGLKAPLFEEKVIDFILGKIKMNIRKLSVEELYAYDPDKKEKISKKTK